MFLIEIGFPMAFACRPISVAIHRRPGQNFGYNEVFPLPTLPALHLSQHLKRSTSRDN
jgi:hypothetical protein